MQGMEMGAIVIVLFHSRWMASHGTYRLYCITNDWLATIEFMLDGEPSWRYFGFTPRLIRPRVLILILIFVDRPMRWAGDAMPLTGPFAEVDEFAALAAEWTPGIFSAPLDSLSAGRAFYVSLHRLQQASLNSTKLSASFGLSSPGSRNAG